MKKRVKYIVGLSIFGLILISTVVFLIAKGRGKDEDISFSPVEKRTIEKKVMATGTINPKVEVAVKSAISGVVDDIFIETGDRVKEGTPLFSVKANPNSLDLNSAESEYERKRIRMEEASSQMEKTQSLFDSQVISEMEYRETRTKYRLAVQDFNEAKNRLLLLKGAPTRSTNGINNIVKAPIAGMILSIELKEGAPVQAGGSYSEGTTIMYLADMETLCFHGTIDESQVGHLQLGLPVKLSVAALEDFELSGTLSFISPKGHDDQGTVIFPLEVEIPSEETVSLRAGYSAGAEIILKKVSDVISVQERDIIMKEGKYFVEKKSGDGIELKEVSVGISDGIYSEVTEGLKVGDLIKVQ